MAIPNPAYHYYDKVVEKEMFPCWYKVSCSNENILKAFATWQVSKFWNSGEL